MGGTGAFGQGAPATQSGAGTGHDARDRSAVTMDYVDYDWGGEIPQSYTVLRAPFDEWFAGEAEAQGDTAKIGALYLKELGRLGLMPTMKLFAGWPHILELPRMFTEYPALANEAIKFMFTVDGKVPPKMTQAMLAILRKHVSFGQLISDGWKSFRAI